MTRTRAQGFVEITGPYGSVTRETYTCCHCNRLDFVPEKDAVEVGFCHQCMSRECVGCAKKFAGRCRPFEEKLRQMEARGALLQAVGIVAFVVAMLAPSVAAAFTSPACVSSAGTGSPLTSTAFSCAVPACQGTFTGTTQYYACDCQTGTHAGSAAAGCVAGSDAVAGTSPATAWQTFEKARQQWASLQPGDRIHLCKGGMFTMQAGQDRFVNNNCTAGNKCVLMDYTASWASGGEGPPTVNIPAGQAGFNTDDGGADTVQTGYSISGIKYVGDGSSTVIGTAGGFFGYNTINDVDMCDIEVYWTSIALELAGGGLTTDHNSNWHVRNCYFHDNGGQGTLAADNGHIVTRSVFVNNGFDRPNFNHNIYLAPPDHSAPVSGVEVSYNELYQSTMSTGTCTATSLVAHGILDSVTVVGNYVHEDAGAASASCYGIQFNPGYATAEQFSNLIIRGNTVAEMGGNGINVSATHVGLIENNVVDMTGNNNDVVITASDDGVVSAQGDWSNQDVVIRNNSTRAASGIGVGMVSSVTRGTVSNNSFVSTASGTVNCFIYDQPAANYTGGIDYNHCYAPSAGTLQWESSTAVTLAAWRVATGFDTHSINGSDPLFTNVSALDFSLTSLSPLKDAGSTVLGPAFDILNRVRPQGASTDIGANEFPVSSTVSRPAGIYGMFLLTLFVLGVASLAGTLSVKKHRAEIADAQHVHLIDEHMTAALAEMGDDDALSLIFRAKCDECGEPAFLPRKRRGG